MAGNTEPEHPSTTNLTLSMSTRRRSQAAQLPATAAVAVAAEADATAGENLLMVDMRKAGTDLAQSMSRLLDVHHARQSEELVIGAMMNDEAVLGQSGLHASLMGLLSVQDFHDDVSRNIWTCSQHLFQTVGVVDPLALLQQARAEELVIGTAQSLMELADKAAGYRPIAIEAAGQRVKRLANIRRTQWALLLQLQESLKPAPDVVVNEEEGLIGADTYLPNMLARVNDAMTNIGSMLQTSRTGPEHIKKAVEVVRARMKAKDEGQQTPEPATFGLGEVDRVTGGLTDEDLIVIAARPGMGKTALVATIEDGCAGIGRASLTFSLEMSAESLALRRLSKRSRITSSRLRRAGLSQAESEQLEAATRALKDETLSYIDDTPGLGLAEIRARSRDFIKQFPRGVVIIDYLQIIAQREGKAVDMARHVQACSMGLKQLARELKCPVIALSQLSRSVEQRANKRPMMSDLRESGQIEQDASLIVFLYRDEYYNPNTPDKGIAEIIIAKNREGALGVVRTAFKGEITAFEDLGAETEDFGYGHDEDSAPAWPPS